MKPLLIAISILFLHIHAFSQSAALKGKSVPSFKLTTFDNQTVSSKSLRGKVVLLDFWEAWCTPCVESMPHLQQLYDNYKDKGLTMYGITHDTKQLETSKQLIAKKGATYPNLIGTDQSKNAFKLISIPLYVLIDKTGKVIFVQEGYSPELETAIRNALSFMQ